MHPFCLRRAWNVYLYNQAMRSALFLALFLPCASICCAQSPASAPKAPEAQKTSTAKGTGEVEKRTERILIEDAGARIDELRVGGETLSIQVQPKTRMPAYQIAPASGERSWKILDF
jgi:hypothetical protein